MSAIRGSGPQRVFGDRIAPSLAAWFGSCFERLCREALPLIYAAEGVAAGFEVGEYCDSVRQYRNRYWNFTKTARFVRWRPSTRSPRPPTSYQSVRSPSIRSACW